MPIERPFKLGADFEHFRKVVMRETTDGPVPIIELMADGSIMGKVTGKPYPVDAMTELMALIDPRGDISPEALEVGLKFMDLSLAFSTAVGYDTVMTAPIVPIPRTRAQYDGCEEQGKSRPWQNEHSGIITDRAAFDSFEWPSLDKISMAPLDYLGELLPSGMKIHVLYMGIFEDLRAIMGFEPMAIKSIEEPELLGDILEQLTVLAEAAVDQAAAHPATGYVFYADDMGFNHATMLSPKFFREWIIPRQKRIAQACHKHGKPFLFHSCGHIDAIMEDLITEVGIDGIHSFQDVIEPVEDVYRKYGDRIAILGGVDVDLLTQGTPEKVRARCRQILDVCGKAGGFAIGSGNSVTSYCKIENYYAMIDETRKWNEEHGYL
jgi:uroporphyrinogen decarboxylase